MKIYTRSGDHGRTSLLGGQQVMKNHALIEAYGSVDELISYLGLIRDLSDDPETESLVLALQDKLMVIASILAAGSEAEKIESLPHLKNEDVKSLEKEIDRLEAQLPALNHFILPGGNILASHLHIARTICRRAERNTVAVKSMAPATGMILKYLNRLSDLLFVMARWTMYKKGGNETIWKPGI